MLATAILAGGLIFALTGQAQQQPGKGQRPGQGQTRPGQGKAGPGQGQRPGQGQARPGRGQGQRPGGGFSRRNPFEGIGLTEEQQKKIDAINQARTEEMRKLREGGAGGDRQDRFAKYRELFEKYQKQTNAVLTEEQKKKMAEARAQRGQGGRDQGQGRRPGQGGRGNPLASLNLTEDQQKQFDAARKEMSTQMRALFTDRDTPREERTAKMAKIRESYEAAIKKTLTEEQFKKYQEARPQRRPGGGTTRPGGGRPRPEGKGKERPKRSDA